MKFPQIVVEIDKHVMLTCGWCELFDSVYLYAKSQVLIEMGIRYGLTSFQKIIFPLWLKI